jgi:hypothetical protein
VQTDATTTELDKLQDDMPDLALAAAERKPGAQEALDRARARIRALSETRELETLVAQGRERRAKEEAESERLARIAGAERRIADAQVRKRELAPTFDAAVAKLCDVIAELKAAGRAEYAATADAGRYANRRALMAEAIAGCLAWRLTEVLPGHVVDRPHLVYRRALADLLAGSNAPQTLADRLAAIEEPIADKEGTDADEA